MRARRQLALLLCLAQLGAVGCSVDGTLTLVVDDVWSDEIEHFELVVVQPWLRMASTISRMIAITPQMATTLISCLWFTAFTLAPWGPSACS